jgi:hypothetical protein
MNVCALSLLAGLVAVCASPELTHAQTTRSNICRSAPGGGTFTYSFFVDQDELRIRDGAQYVAGASALSGRVPNAWTCESVRGDDNEFQCTRPAPDGTDDTLWVELGDSTATWEVSVSYIVKTEGLSLEYDRREFSGICPIYRK